VGSVIRVKAHASSDGGTSPAGEVFSFIAVKQKQPDQPDGVSGLWNYRSYKNTDTFIYPNAPQTRNELILQEALLKLEATLQGGITTLQGTIEWLESMRPAPPSDLRQSTLPLVLGRPMPPKEVRVPYSLGGRDEKLPRIPRH
jgi:hypothetical protein